MDALRVLAKSTDPDRAVLVEKYPRRACWTAGGRELEHSERVCSLGAA